MHFLIRVCLRLLLLGALVNADVTFVSPAAGGSVTANTPFQVTWSESAISPLISTFSAYDLVLYTGTNDAPKPLVTLKTAGQFTTNVVSVTIDPGVGGSDANAYFLGMRSTLTAGGVIVNYSNRFTVAGMVGVFNPALSPITTIAGPPRDVSGLPASNPPSGVAAPPASVAFVSFQLQTGPTRYAPMQIIPPTKITATNTNPVYPTSAVQFASAYLAPAVSIVTTVEPAGKIQTFASHPNTAAAATQPVDAMQRFLNRWKD